jgi:hypothetical protein
MHAQRRTRRGEYGAAILQPCNDGLRASRPEDYGAISSKGANAEESWNTFPAGNLGGACGRGEVESDINASHDRGDPNGIVDL